MKELSVNDKIVTVDDEGFLVNRDDWDEDVARAIAKHLDIPDLDEEQVEIISFMRSYYNKFHAFPILRNVCKQVKQTGACVNNEFVDPMKAWKIAGLPKLDGIHFVTVDGVNYLLEECC
ncbi:TusE/DsrC/DsvC family sulfur relay protein [Desulfofustis glycolicus]|jgi:tRNA 2-thiouridine synthesizing protein E|uniref:tRNA 2-thiouridine synthesizing protein E n=1 Tax=Desulfofustis glycolicus DSM 9705 TaxID=1121409 RepID=A0A1M5Y132_9BACT|nr:TusE/DsrC/DsvC family sulfur relay protein [Desulfofustis glycolicus]MCB2217714.1 TusE/DsrC/DsvC family sulfur relay protein [Desulfobulbaceae bacterium]MEE4315284.1 TusE/DsrC/DsvC family sulfur relay protein [Desulfofustis sp.]SHI05775.1 tRNA 2-thiouridine synthesizing protein E [Desulfofustis glycolicus DSM 9705]